MDVDGDSSLAGQAVRLLPAADDAWADARLRITVAAIARRVMSLITAAPSELEENE